MRIVKVLTQLRQSHLKTLQNRGIPLEARLPAKAWMKAFAFGDTHWMLSLKIMNYVIRNTKK